MRHEATGHEALLGLLERAVLPAGRETEQACIDEIGPARAREGGRARRAERAADHVRQERAARLAVDELGLGPVEGGPRELLQGVSVVDERGGCERVVRDDVDIIELGRRLVSGTGAYGGYGCKRDTQRTSHVVPPWCGELLEPSTSTQSGGDVTRGLVGEAAHPSIRPCSLPAAPAARSIQENGRPGRARRQ